MTDFNQMVQRKNTNSVKWDAITETYPETELLPMWVADMDFLSPTFVTDALQRFATEEVLGYSIFPDNLYQAVIAWQQRHHHFHLNKEDILFSSGVVPSIVTAIQAYTQPGDAILIQDPVYHPFAHSVENNQRKLVTSRLINQNQHFEIDFVDFEKKIIAENVKLFILCNPHNPGGRVWSQAELAQLGSICKKHQVLVLSDEIHQDLVFQPNVFTTFQNAADPQGEYSIVFTAATKTFNLAGIKNSMVFIKNPELRGQFVECQTRNCSTEINTFGLIGTEAAYQFGDEWLAELLLYLQENINIATTYFKEELPQVKVMIPEGTYLMWLDFSDYPFSDEELQDRFIHKGKILMNAGNIFGSAGIQHARLNLATQKATLLEGLSRIKLALM
ncbi:cystathionine beta-lyase [Enterococcus sp. PF1-24]|uniref:MalY/PatB family protein n=1 Tax=unclassified Enterococcus TaxID=2608891 RepID=UPI0024740364|nr:MULTISPECIES: MalY/PatB family protein [unclassified Enterococcus]MDH6365843.1 cystathionine beta-lyase [Enterococcus sp. PFB1-1]MDH6402935.1 cystathionine beta-lyase [Enterococcus sp. PF1-24]